MGKVEFQEPWSVHVTCESTGLSMTYPGGHVNFKTVPDKLDTSSWITFKVFMMTLSEISTCGHSVKKLKKFCAKILVLFSGFCDIYFIFM